MPNYLAFWRQPVTGKREERFAFGWRSMLNAGIVAGGVLLEQLWGYDA